jgi:hypothetical protein
MSTRYVYANETMDWCKEAFGQQAKRLRGNLALAIMLTAAWTAGSQVPEWKTTTTAPEDWPSSWDRA